MIRQQLHVLLHSKVANEAKAMTRRENYRFVRLKQPKNSAVPAEVLKIYLNTMK